MKIALFIAVLLCADILSKAEDSRPILEQLKEPAAVSYPEFGFTILVPANSKLLGKRGPQDAVNYVFPWIRTPFWNIDFAFENLQPKGSLDDRVLGLIADMSKRPTPLWKYGKVEARTFGGIRFDRVPCKGKKGYAIVRFYFVTPDDKLAYLHVHGVDDFDVFESILHKTIQKLKS